MQMATSSCCDVSEPWPFRNGIVIVRTRETFGLPLGGFQSRSLSRPSPLVVLKAYKTEEAARAHQQYLKERPRLPLNEVHVTRALAIKADLDKPKECAESCCACSRKKEEEAPEVETPES